MPARFRSPCVDTHPRFIGGSHSCERLLCRRVIQMSPAPQPPGRVLWKNITCSSEESTARESAALVLSADMFSGSPQGSSSEARVVNHRSSPPRPPGRSEVSNRQFVPRQDRVVVVVFGVHGWSDINGRGPLPKCLCAPPRSIGSGGIAREHAKQSQGSPHDRLFRSSNAVNIQPMHGIRQAATGRTLVVAPNTAICAPLISGLESGTRADRTSTMSQPALPSTEDRLDSWKDIAVYLKRDISTVQRWEQREKMPVHRHQHDRRGSVAFRCELDVWLETRRTRLKQDAERRALDGVGTFAPASAMRSLARLHWMRAAVTTALVLASIAYLFVSSRVATTPRMIRSVAVLPLQNLSGDSGQDFFVDGMTEALIERLSSMQGVRVISRTSVMQFKHSSQSLPEIAKALRVDAVVEGSVARSGRRVHISAKLIRGESEDHLWSGSYDREAGDVLALQSEVAQAIARQIQISVAGRVRLQEYAQYARSVARRLRRLSEGPLCAEQNADAGSRGECAVFRGGDRKGCVLRTCASGLGAAHAVLSPFGGDEPVDALAKAAQAAGRALELDATIAEAHLVLGEVALRRWQWTDAEALPPRPRSRSEQCRCARRAGSLAALSAPDGRSARVGATCPRAGPTRACTAGTSAGYFSNRAAMRTPFASSTRYSPDSQTKREPCVPRLCDD